MKTFQTVLLGIFGFFIVAGVIAVASFGRFGGGGGDVPAEAVVWGTLDQNMVQRVITLFNQDNDNILNVEYVQFGEDEFDQELTEALAEQRGPDAIIISNEGVLKHEKKIYAVPFESVSERFFRDTYIEGAELYITDNGILALPLFVDPMVMYWNRTLFNSAGIAKPPALWEEVNALVSKLTKSDEAFNILQSAIALGEYRNVNHAKEVLSTMIMQAGNPITIRTNGRIQSILSDRLDLPEIPADAAVRFYTEFSNPVKPSYSWNRSLPNAKDFFVQGNVAMYLGFSSELFEIKDQNPNLNFDVTRIPQVRDAVDKTTFGTVYGVAVLNQSPRKPNAFAATSILAGNGMAQFWVDEFALPPARRDMLANIPTDPYKAVFYQDALISRGFFDADSTQTNAIFASLIEGVTSGRFSVSQAVSQADGQLDRLLAQ